ncbi:sigma-70 family RNA polymerase sigma factor [Anaerophilus nitritogenes]|uniref:sigma-70 family RNA polymerase sigma factor n=1 Tax=Anaerophilus nitritogenes TaxID=2498136 RepID=UPI00101D8162|nr:sigma-70 family RNA polymerase sigma factor [Anaerophilus nitritogenes]
MKELVEKFLEDPKMKDLYIQAKTYNNQEAYETLNKEFNNYLFEVKFLSYISKTLSLSSKDFYRKYCKLKNKEKLLLNEENENFDTPSINNIPDQSINFEEEIIQLNPFATFCDIIADYKIVQAIEYLGKKQKLILYKSFVEEKTNTQIARELGVSQPFVSKTKKAALKKLKYLLKEGCKWNY